MQQNLYFWGCLKTNFQLKDSEVFEKKYFQKHDKKTKLLDFYPLIDSYIIAVSA